MSSPAFWTPAGELHLEHGQLVGPSRQPEPEPEPDWDGIDGWWALRCLAIARSTGVAHAWPPKRLDVYDPVNSTGW